MMRNRICAAVLPRITAIALIAVLMLTLLPASVSVSAAPKDEKKIVVSLGDSFSSGEGIEKFYYQDLSLDEKIYKEDWLAHRSQKSWPGKLKVPGLSGTLADHKEDGGWYFVASSGAVTGDVIGKNKDGKIVGQSKKYTTKDGEVLHSTNLPPQLDIFQKIDAEEVDYVTLTLGGNDAGFSDIIATAAKEGIPGLESGHLADKLDAAMGKADTILADLKTVYGKIAELAPSAEILVAGYPRLLDPVGGSLVWFSKKDATSSNSAVDDFNGMIQDLVRSCNKAGTKIHFVSVTEEFDGHESYRNIGIDYINGIYTQPKSQDLNQQFLEASAYSMHPNHEGAKAYARCVQAKIDELEGLSNVTCTTPLQIAVRGYNGKPYGDYEIQIKGKENSGPFGWIKKEYSKEYTVTSTEPKSIKLPEGTYKITVTDGDISYHKNVTVKKKALQNGLLYETDFGYVPDDDPSGGGNDLYPDYVPDRVTSDERDVVLVLDVSGSMSGEPMEQTKRAARKFIDTVLQQDASIGLVTYDNYANMVSDFTVDGDYLNSCVNSLYGNGNTNIDAGLSVAQEMLRQSNAKKKIIVLMSDGLPNDGREGQQLVDFSNEIKDENVLIYTLGFFGKLGDKSQPQMLMEGIASEGCHYEVDDADNLVFFFEDMADQINGTRFIYIRIACPVEVTVTHNGETLTSDGQTKSQRTDFGTLTFEQSADGSTDEKSRVKILRLKEGESYDVQITGTGRGIMNYTIGFMDEDGQYSDMREFRNIKINKNTIIDTVADTGRTTTLKVDEDGDGKYDIRYRAGEGERAEEVKDTWLYIVVGVAVLVAAAAIVVLKAKKTKNIIKKEEGN